MLARELDHDRLSVENLENRTLLAGDLQTAAVEIMADDHVEVTMNDQVEVSSPVMGAASIESRSHGSLDFGNSASALNSELLNNLFTRIQDAVDHVRTALQDFPGASDGQANLGDVVKNALHEIRGLEESLNNTNLALTMSLGADVLGGSLNSDTHANADSNSAGLKSATDLGLNSDGSTHDDGSATVNMDANMNVSADHDSVNADADIRDDVAMALATASVASSTDAEMKDTSAQTSSTGATTFAITPGTPDQTVDPAAVIGAVNDRSEPGSLEGVRDGIDLDHVRWTS